MSSALACGPSLCVRSSSSRSFCTMFNLPSAQYTERAASRLSASAGFSLYASWKCFSALTPARNFCSRTCPSRRWKLAFASLLCALWDWIPFSSSSTSPCQSRTISSCFSRSCRSMDSLGYRQPIMPTARSTLPERAPMLGVLSTKVAARPGTLAPRRSETEGLDPCDVPWFREDVSRHATGACRRASSRAAGPSCTGQRNAAQQHPCRSSSETTGAVPSRRSCAPA